jgi:transposase
VIPQALMRGSKSKGRSHVGVETLGLVLQAIVHPANTQDRDGGGELLTALAERFPLLANLFADGAYHGPQLRKGVATVRPELAVESITRRDQIKGFVAFPTRWIVERTRAWLNRNRRLAQDFENRMRYALAFVHLASIRLMVRKLCNPS